MQPEELATHVVLLVKSALVPLLERIAAAEARLAVLGDVRDRVVVIETKQAMPAQVAVSDPANAEARAFASRLAALEETRPVPGPPGAAGVDGKDGTNGHDGVNGIDGKDGVGFDDLGVEFDGDRTIALKFARGATVKTFPIVLPFMKYLGVYQDAKSYDVGDTVTWAGQVWFCKASTVTPPGDGSKAWQLCVRKGRDGKDGRDAATLPVVSIGRTGGS